MKTPTVRFNVGGTVYEVSRSLLEQYPDTMLARLVSGAWNKNNAADDNNDNTQPVPADETEPFFIERDGGRFSLVLDYMRDGRISIPAAASGKVTKQSILDDLQYFGFDNVQASVVSVESNTLDCVAHLGNLEKAFQEKKEENRSNLASLEETYKRQKTENELNEKCLDLAFFLYQKFKESGGTETDYTINWMCPEERNWALSISRSNKKAVFQESLGVLGLQYTKFEVGIDWACINIAGA